MTQGKYLCVCTDLRLKGWRYLIPFFKLAGPVFEQSRATPGNVKTDRRGNPLALRFQTLTVWQDRESMEKFVYGEPHRTAIAKFEEWSEEDSRIASWWQDTPEVTWEDALARAKAASNYPRRK